MKQQSKTTNTLDSYLQKIIDESMRSTLQRRALQEKEVQQAQTAPPAEKSASPSEGGEEKEKLEKGDITHKDIIEKLNSIRAGKSFKDKEISAALQGYVEDMTTPEKTALFAFLKGISQIVTGEIEGTEAVDPGDKVPSIEMTKDSPAKKVTVKPLVIKQTQKEKKPAGPPAEDTSGPVPIKPKSK
jgi:hypothetical protein